jgi:hypothetical protein
MRTQRAPIDTIQRPYVGKDALDINEVRERKTNDTSWPPKLTVELSMAFEKMANNATPVPPTPPTPTPQRGRDPVYLVLGNYEVGTRVEVVSLSDHPDADFSAKSKDKIFELPLTGRDVTGRRASIALDEEQMKEKGIVPGETLLIRQVDEAGNASEPTLVYLDPSNWAQQAFNEPLATGGTQQVMGRRIDVFVGDHGVAGSVNPAGTVAINAKAAQDTSAPVILDKNIRFNKQPDGKVEFAFDKAFEPGATVSVQNLDSAQTESFAITETNRSGSMIRNIVDGDRFKLTVTDRAGQVSTYDFAYSAKAADGKATVGKSHTLKAEDIRLEAFAGLSPEVIGQYRQAINVLNSLTGQHPVATALQTLTANHTSWKAHHSYAHLAGDMDAAIKLWSSPDFVKTHIAELAKIGITRTEAEALLISDFNELVNKAGAGVMLKVNAPVPSNVNFDVVVNSTTANFRSTPTNRDVSIKLPSLKVGDPVVVNYTDREGKLHSFTYTYNDKAKDGRLQNNVLQMRLATNRLTSNV